MIRLTFIIGLIFNLFNGCVKNSSTSLIDENKIHQYVDNFNKNDIELYQQYIPNVDVKSFLLDNIPLIDLPSKDIEETYYFRWWTYRKHLKETEDGFVITEFLPEVNWSKKHNTINCTTS